MKLIQDFDEDDINKTNPKLSKKEQRIKVSETNSRLSNWNEKFKERVNIQRSVKNKLTRLEKLGMDDTPEYERKLKEYESAIRWKITARRVRDEAKQDLSALQGKDYYIYVDGYENIAISRSKADQLIQDGKFSEYVLKRNITYIRNDLKNPDLDDKKRNQLEVILQKFLVNLESGKSGKSIEEILEEDYEDVYGELNEYLEEANKPKDYPIQFIVAGNVIKLT